MKTREFFPCAGHDWCVRGEKTAVGALALVKPLVDIGLGGIGLFPAGVFMMKWANRRVFTMKCISGYDKLGIVAMRLQVSPTVNGVGEGLSRLVLRKFEPQSYIAGR